MNEQKIYEKMLACKETNVALDSFFGYCNGSNCKHCEPDYRNKAITRQECGEHIFIKLDNKFNVTKKIEEFLEILE